MGKSREKRKLNEAQWGGFCCPITSVEQHLNLPHPPSGLSLTLLNCAFCNSSFFFFFFLVHFNPFRNC